MALFDEAGKQAIERAIAEVERESAGELAVVTVRASGAYSELRIFFASAVAIMGTALAHRIRPELEAGYLLWLELAIGALGWFATGWRALLRAMLPAGYAEAHVQRRAREVFFERNLFATRDRTGVLILLSELERRVTILGDSGIHAAVETAGWQAHVQRVVEAIRAGRPASGVCEVIRALGETLKKELPRKPDDENELPNEVVEEP